MSTLTLESVSSKLQEIKEKTKALIGELTLYDDGSGEVYLDFDDPDRENLEKQFITIENLEMVLEDLIAENTTLKEVKEENILKAPNK